MIIVVRPDCLSSQDYFGIYGGGMELVRCSRWRGERGTGMMMGWMMTLVVDIMLMPRTDDADDAADFDTPLSVTVTFL